MKQLDLRFYPLDEVAAETGRERDSHFARNVKDDLTKWGYEFTWKNRAGVQITKRPETAEQRLQELMTRRFKLDVQIDAKDFACFIYLLLTYDGFSTMPHEARCQIIHDWYDIDICAERIQRWKSRLIQTDNLTEDRNEKTYWMTTYVDGKKCQEELEPDDPTLKEYRAYQSKLIEQYKVDGTLPKGAWAEIGSALQQKFHVRIYACPKLVLNILGDEAQNITTWCAEVVQHIEKESEE